MNRNFSVLKILMIILFLFIIIYLVYLFQCSATGDSIKIGAVLPLTGDGTPDQGQASQKAITLAIDQINLNGGINGKQVKAIFEDSQCSAEKGVTAIRKLIDVDKVDFIIGDICDSVTAAIVPIAESSHKVLITPGSTSPDISNAGDYIFRFWFSETDLGGIAASQAYKMNFRNLSILYINNAWGIAQKNAVSAKFIELGGKVVIEQAINPDESDYKTIILKSEQKNPDVYYIGLHPNGLVDSIKKMNELGVHKQIFSHGGLVGSTQVLGLGGSLLEGIIAPFVYEPTQDFKNKFISKFGVQPGITADSSYDIVNVVAKIIDKANKADSNTIKIGLYATKNYSGASGMISVDDKGDVHRPLELMIVKNSQLVPYQ